jgi:hypothetical protein
MDGISRETFEQMNTDSKLNILFDFVVNIEKNATIARGVTEALAESMRQRKKFDSATAAVMGFVGGVIAHLGQLTLFSHK